MTAPTPNTPPALPLAAAKPMTAADAAKRVKRPVIALVDAKDKDGNDIKVPKVVKHAPVTADEVLAFKDYGDYVNVVTKDGQKFTDRDDA
jgi:DNA-binding LytR/AlgR family response regulator